MARIEKKVVVEGGHYLRKGADSSVIAVQWNKDGDHPSVERYPIEGRDYKGLIVVDPKTKFPLKFGDWVLEDQEGRLYTVDAEKFATEYVEVERAVTPAKAADVAVMLAVVLLLSWLAPGAEFLPVVFGVTHLMYYRALLGQWNGLANSVFDLDTDTMKASAHTNTYAPNQDTHEFFGDVTNEVTGTNYTAGGATLGTVTVARTTGTVTFDAADVVWTQHAAGFSTGRKFVVYRSTGVAATSKLFSVVTADADVGNVTGDLTLQWSASGIAQWTTT